VTFISYAQNFEDVALWRALKLYGPGFYIDIGANHPSIDSVTRSLYERGWRGVNVEPVQRYHEALCAARPRDVNLCVAVGSKDAGELQFFESPETGLSTLCPEMAAQQSAAGICFTPRKVTTRTLVSLCEEHVPQAPAFQFLKIDVEGFEEQVLQGMDFRRWRPWIVLVESPYHTEPDWESLILAAGYQFALCDGLNRYYVAQERIELLVPLALPPNLLDGFVLCPGHSLSHPADKKTFPQDQYDKALQRAEAAEAQLEAIYASRLWAFGTMVRSLKSRFSRR